MDLGLKGQKALIMGAGRGIGYQIAETLAVEGAEVGIFARDEDRLQEAADAIHKTAGRQPLIVAGDASKREDIESAVRETHRHLGRIDILVNCVGGYTPNTFMGLTDEEFMDLMQTKWLGYVRAMRAVVPIMKAQNGGHILNVAGNSGKNPGNPHAGSVNSAVVNVSKCVADEVGPDRILVNCVCPGITLTEHSRHIMQTQAEMNDVSYEKMVERTAAKIPLGFLGRVQDVAYLAVFLVSPRNVWITGTAISVDGGTNRYIG